MPGCPSGSTPGADPTLVAAARLVRPNVSMSEQIGLDPAALSDPDGAQIYARNVVPAGAEPIALACAGHRFGHFVPQLGDGRAILLGEVVRGTGCGATSSKRRPECRPLVAGVARTPKRREA